MISLDAQHPRFPAVAEADADGLLAIGGNLEVATLCAAYRRGIFPWYTEGQPILWWSPHPRMVLLTNKMRISRSLGKTIRLKFKDLRLNHNFAAVIDHCAAPSNRRTDTWITRAMRDAYLRMHRLGFAHSVEVYQRDTLVGGLYGVGIGCMFFGESMFSVLSDASKVALFYLCRHLCAHRIRLIDCQMSSQHLQTLGAFAIERRRFIDYVVRACRIETPPGLWTPQRFVTPYMAQRQQAKEREQSEQRGINK